MKKPRSLTFSFSLVLIGLLTWLFTATPASATYFLKNVLWPQTTLTVCFVDDVTYIEQNIAQIHFERTLKTPYRQGVFPFIEYSQEGVVPFPPDLKRGIMDGILQSFAATGLRFIGWQRCRDTDNPNIIFVYSQLQRRDMPVAEASSIGYAPKKYNYGSPINKHIAVIRINQAKIAHLKNRTRQKLVDVKRHFSAVKIDVEESAQKWSVMDTSKTLIHELGHLLGLLHEFSRIDNQAAYRRTFLHPRHRDYNRNSTAMTIQAQSEGNDRQRIDGLEFFGHYDFRSVMEYWWTFNSDELFALEAYCRFVNNRQVCDESILSAFSVEPQRVYGYFSPQDVQTLRSLYLGEPYKEVGHVDYLRNAQFLGWAANVRQWGRFFSREMDE